MDYGQVARTYGKEFESRGGKIYTKFEVDGFNSSAEGLYNNFVRFNQIIVVPKLSTNVLFKLI